MALLVWREEDQLPQVAAEDETAVLAVLVTEREHALAEATRLRDQLHQLLLQIDPEYRSHLPHLQSKAGLRALETYTAPGTTPSALQQTRVRAVRRRRMARTGPRRRTNLRASGATTGAARPPRRHAG